MVSGYRSRARSVMKGSVDEPKFSGNSAFRALIPCSLLQDPELLPLIDFKDQSCYAWYVKKFSISQSVTDLLLLGLVVLTLLSHTQSVKENTTISFPLSLPFTQKVTTT
jgi:hypothetical protein